MQEIIRVGIVGYGNVGKGVEKAIYDSEDMELVAIFSRRKPELLNSPYDNSKFKSYINILQYEKDIDVMIMCGGSATDLEKQTVYVVQKFNTVDTFDKHAKIPEYFDSINSIAQQTGKMGLISIGWDPGLFSIMRLLSEAVLPNGNTYTFWGKGVSQGHSDAIRRIEGVKNAIQYTIPIEEAVKRVKNGENPELTTREKHIRECFVVLYEDADKDKVEASIKNMPIYFADYDTTVHFITEEEFKANHTKMMHGGFVIRTGNTGENQHIIDYSLKLDSNPEFTGSVAIAYARACYMMNKEGIYGAKTIYDIPMKYLINKSYDELLKEML